MPPMSSLNKENIITKDESSTNTVLSTNLNLLDVTTDHHTQNNVNPNANQRLSSSSSSLAKKTRRPSLDPDPLDDRKDAMNNTNNHYPSKKIHSQNEFQKSNINNNTHNNHDVVDDHNDNNNNNNSVAVNSSDSPSQLLQQCSPKPSPDQSAGLTCTDEKSTMYPDRVILTTYPNQTGINPILLHWGSSDPFIRGPIIVSRSSVNTKIRNAIGASSGSYCIYHALAVAIGALPTSHKSDYTNTEPTVNIGPHPSWGNPHDIVSMDPFGHLAPHIYKKFIDDGIDVRPSAAITKAHMIVPEIQTLLSDGKLSIDGQIIINSKGELSVTKAAVEPVWWLPGVAKRFSTSEANLRRSLFEDTGGMYPELITRPDLKVFLPPIGGLTVYIFGQVENISNSEKKLTVRVHDECNGSDVFGSDLCTCRPYLIYGIEECIKTAQSGGSGIIVYFRKEGRALGEVTKYLVYNARKRQAGGDSAANYFLRTELIAGVKDMRFQALMPDVLHWLGITKIDRFISMSNMKYEAIIKSGIKILERVAIPDELIPADSQVEINAKIASGYYTSGKIPSVEELSQTKGRSWDDIQH